MADPDEGLCWFQLHAQRDRGQRRERGGTVAARVGQAAAKVSRGCNSFAPDTDVLMADGTTEPISDLQVADLVAARDPTTGELTGQPVLNVIVGVGDKHLTSVTTAPAPPAAVKAGEIADPAGLLELSSKRVRAVARR